MGWTVTSAGRATYVGERPRFCHMGLTLTYWCLGNKRLIHFEMRKNGVRIPGSGVKSMTGDSLERSSTAIHIIGDSYQKNDYVELWCMNETNDDNIVMESVNHFGLMMPNVV